MNKDRNDTSHRWTTEELMRFVAMWAADAPIADLVKEFNSSATAIRAQVVRLRAQGIPLKRRRAGNMAGKFGTPWTQEDIQYVVRRRAERATNEQIAVELNRTFHAIQGIVQAIRKAGADIKMYGGGRRRLWDADKVHAAAVMDNVIPIERARVAA